MIHWWPISANVQLQQLTSYEEDILYDEIIARLKGSLPYDNPKLLEVIKKNYLQEPSFEPYNLMADKKDYKSLIYNKYATQESLYGKLREILFKVLGEVKEGFFVEAGAVDGEFLSNTILLERKLGWSGLLVEADGDMYQSLMTRHRKAWTSHSCLAVHPYPHREVFLKYGSNAEFIPGTNLYARGHGVLSMLEHLSPMRIVGDTNDNFDRLYESVQCLPLGSLLLALNVTHVHFISLDVEGAEVLILKFFPWDVITVDVWLVEHFPTRVNSAEQPSGQPLQNVKKDTNDINVLPSPLDDNHNSSNQISPEQAHTTQYQLQHQQGEDNTFIDFFISKGYHRFPMDLVDFQENYLFIRTNSNIYKHMGLA